MTENLATIMVRGVGIYLALGVVFAIPFVLCGVGKIDSSAAKGSWGFKIIIIPGVAALWPLMAWRWMKKLSPPLECNAHRVAASRSRVDPENSP